MKISKGIFAVVCIVFTIQFALVECDQALGTRINAMSLNTIANRDRLLGGSNVGGLISSAPSFQIWIKGIVTADFNAVSTAITSAGCELLSSNIGNAAKGLPHWNYVVARIRCSTDAKWKTLVYNQAFYSRVAFTERSFSIQQDSVTSVQENIIPKRIAVWQGKVNQHTASGNMFSTDPDGTSGAELDKLTYCRKWWPQTTGIKLVYQAETITGWRDAGNTGGPYTRKVNSTLCIQPINSSSSAYKRNTEVDISAPPQLSKEEREHLKSVYDNMMRSIEQYNTTLQFHFEQEQKRAGIVGRIVNPNCPENPAKRDEMINSLETEKEKNALRKALTTACDTSSGTPPPPYYPPPPPPPPSNCPQPPIAREAMEDMQTQIEAAETEAEKQAIIAKYAYPTTDCPPSPPTTPPQPPYVPPSIFQCAQVNENTNAVLTCPTGKVIKKIEYASYGNSPALASCAEYPRTTRVQYGSCHSSSSEYVVNRQCCGQSSCIVPATNAMFVDPCNGVAKTLRIKAICDVPEKIECSMPICGTYPEGNSVTLQCPSGMSIKTVNFAAYSAVPSTSCYNSFATSGVCPGNPDLVRNKTIAMCKNKNSCQFIVNSATFGGDFCPGKAKSFGVQALCATHEPYNQGLDQAVSMQPTSNPSWESANSRPWTNYFEYLGWTPSVDYYNTNFGGTFYLLDQGIYEMHQEFITPGVTPDTTKIRRLPNVRNPDSTKQYDGFLTQEDREVKNATGSVIRICDPWLEDDIAHGTTNAAIAVGNTLGLSRTVPLYHAKVAQQWGGLVVHAFTSAMQNINILSGTTGHARPSIVMIPTFFQFGMGYCVTSRVEAVPQEPICSLALIDEINTAYNIGIIVVLPSGNGFNWWTDLYTNFYTGTDFIYEAGTPYKNAQICDPEPISAVGIDICNSASRVFDTDFNVWDLYLPIYNQTTQKPLIVTANDVNGRILRFRDIVYNANDVKNTPWTSIGSPNVGSTCVDYASFGIQFSKTAANYWSLEDDTHKFTTGYREAPYMISATSYSVATAGSIAMYYYGRYGGQSYSGQNIENMKYYMSQYGKRVTDDVDSCKNNYWQIIQDSTQYPRLRYI